MPSMTGVDNVLSKSSTKATKKIIESGVAGRNILSYVWSGVWYQTSVV